MEDDDKDQQILKLMDRVPDQLTAAGARFTKSIFKDIGFFNFITHSIVKMDYASFVARKALDSQEWKDTTEEAHLKNNPGPLVKVLRRNRQTFIEMFLARAADAFQSYIVDIIRLVLHSNPKMLSTAKSSITLEELAKYSSLDDLYADLIEKRVLNLSYEGFDSLVKWCKERGVEIDLKPEEAALAVEFIATRNIIAHNHCIVDERYKTAVPTSTLELGALCVLDSDDYFKACGIFSRIAYRIDGAAVAKFGLPTEATRTRPDDPPLG